MGGVWRSAGPVMRSVSEPKRHDAFFKNLRCVRLGHGSRAQSGANPSLCGRSRGGCSGYRRYCLAGKREAYGHFDHGSDRWAAERLRTFRYVRQSTRQWNRTGSGGRCRQCCVRSIRGRCDYPKHLADDYRNRGQHDGQHGYNHDHALGSGAGRIVCSALYFYRYSVGPASTLKIVMMAKAR